jgi:hypothetical protein
MTATMTIAQFIAKHNVSMFVEASDRNPNMADDEWSRTASHWRCLLRCGRKSMTVYYSQGSAHVNPPTLNEVLGSVLSDARGTLEQDFAGWCGDYGYDTDSIKALKTYRACERMSSKLHRLLGEARYSELLDCDDDQ